MTASARGASRPLAQDAPSYDARSGFGRLLSPLRSSQDKRPLIWWWTREGRQVSPSRRNATGRPWPSLQLPTFLAPALLHALYDLLAEDRRVLPQRTSLRVERLRRSLTEYRSLAQTQALSCYTSTPRNQGPESRSCSKQSKWRRGCSSGYFGSYRR